MSRVTHFEIHAEDTARAMKFYESIFGWKFQKWDGPWEYFLIMTGDKKDSGIDGGLIKRRGSGPSEEQEVNAYVCTIGVDSVDDYVKKVEQNSGKVVVPKMPIQGVGYLAYCKDTEGNIFGIMQNDPSAK